jgi:hypothetical protein
MTTRGCVALKIASGLPDSNSAVEEAQIHWIRVLGDATHQAVADAAKAPKDAQLFFQSAQALDDLVARVVKKAQ